MIVRSRVGTALLVATLMCGLLAAPAAANVIIEDFSNAALVTYDPSTSASYHGTLSPAGSGYLSGWDIGGRYYNIVDLGSQHVMQCNHAYGNFNIGSYLTASSNSYIPTWDAAQAGEAISLADAEDLQVQIVNTTGGSGGQDVVPVVTMYYYDSSAAATTSVAAMNIDATWAVDEAKTFSVAVNDISGFDKSADLVYGFGINSTWVRIGELAERHRLGFYLVYPGSRAGNAPAGCSGRARRAPAPVGVSTEHVCPD